MTASTHQNPARNGGIAPTVERVSPPSPIEALMTAADVSAYLDIPSGTLANWRYQGEGPVFVRLGRHVRYRVSDVEAWVDSRISSTRVDARSDSPRSP